MRNVVDVGASIGLFSNYVATKGRYNSKNPTKVFAVEPIPGVAAQIKEKSNLTVVPVALLPKARIPQSGQVQLNVHRNSELSSLRNLRADIDTRIWSTHLKGTDLKEVISVSAMTLEALISHHNIPRVDFLKIDTQGEDLDILESAGSLIGRIQAVVIEVPYTYETSLYESEVALNEAIEKARHLGFYPVRITPNGGGECNLFLNSRHQDIGDYFRMETALGLAKAPTLKIGPHVPFAEVPWFFRGIVSARISISQIIRRMNEM